MPSKKGSESSICLEKDGNISFDPKINARIFKDFYSNLASDLVNKRPTATSKYDMNYVRDYYNNIDIPDGPFGFAHVHESQVTNILENLTLTRQLVLMACLALFLRRCQNTV